MGKPAPDEYRLLENDFGIFSYLKNIKKNKTCHIMPPIKHFSNLICIKFKMNKTKFLFFPSFY